MSLLKVLIADGLIINEKASTDKEKHLGCPWCGTVNDPESDRLVYTVANDKV